MLLSVEKDVVGVKYESPVLLYGAPHLSSQTCIDWSVIASDRSLSFPRVDGGSTQAGGL